PEMRRISQIIVASRDEATRILEKARTADARAFRQLAQEHSTDRETKLRGGDVRYFPQTNERRPEDPEVPEPIVRATFGIENIGDVSAQPVEVGSGRWAIVKLTGRRPAEHRTLEQAEPSIRNRLWRERRQSTIDEFVADLRRRANVEVHEELLNLIVLSAGEDEAIPGLGTPPGTPRIRGPGGPGPGGQGGPRPGPGRPGPRPGAPPPDPH
ncbi:MAG: peptidyl-prolyl cis-trans isomerase, partial [Deltaproteobacteria bacterium]|nr:peptidyl-prolyl cis-trans isomerase [Deltaproteobacteria bacterium]